MKNLLLLVALFYLCSCGKKVYGTVFGDSFPAENVLVSTDSGKKTIKTPINGYFKFRVKTKNKTCRLMAWQNDTTKVMDVLTYNFGAGPVDMRVKTKGKQ